uniref:Uncharacterized protein n=1 Tax=Glossina morsitans morsitans TaxID=37546 RepID=A0A1B0FQ68_GLOMM
MGKMQQRLQEYSRQQRQHQTESKTAPCEIVAELTLPHNKKLVSPVAAVNNGDLDILTIRACFLNPVSKVHFVCFGKNGTKGIFVTEWCLLLFIEHHYWRTVKYDFSIHNLNAADSVPYQNKMALDYKQDRTSDRRFLMLIKFLSFMVMRIQICNLMSNESNNNNNKKVAGDTMKDSLEEKCSIKEPKKPSAKIAI